MNLKLNNNLKILFITILCMCILLGLTTEIKAATSFTTKLTASKSQAVAGDEITIGITISDINVGNGIQAIQGKLTYDTEKLTYSSITASNGWGSPVYNPENGMVVVESSNYVTEEQEIMKVTFKVKEGVEAGSAKIQFQEVQASDGEIMADGSTSVTSIDIKLASSEEDENNNTNDTNQAGNNGTNDTNQTGNNNTNDTNQVGNNNTNDTNQAGNNNINNTSQTGKNNSNNNSLRNNSSNNGSLNKQTTANNSLPKTGISNTIAIIAVIVAIIGIISYLRYKKYRGIK